jgi:hypothetical protein
MNILGGMNEDQDHCLVENKTDPCLLSNWNRKEVIIIGVDDDDCLVIGKEEPILWLIIELKRMASI